MPALRGTRPIVYVAAALLLVALAITPVLAPWLLSTASFEPHGSCFLWNSDLLRVFVTTDTLIGLSYVAISLALVALVYQTRRDIPFHWLFLAFGAFIVACGSTHFVDALTLWYPVYWLSAATRLVTAVASVTTAVALPLTIPRIRDTVQAAKVSHERKQRLELAHRELELLYARLKLLDATRAQFYANVSHELRTPLALILGPVELLLGDEQLTPAQRHELEVVRRNAASLLAHVNNLLDTARIESGGLRLNYAQVDLAQLASRCAEQFASMAAERHITFHVATGPSLPAQVDPEQIQRIIVNLLANAFKFTPAKGRIALDLHAADARATLTVADSGPGVPPEQRGRIFERFHQGGRGENARFGGSGLGLFIARELTELHSGTITVEQAPDGGALFRVELPLRAPLGTPVAPAPDPELAAPLALPTPPPPAPDNAALPSAAPDDQRPLVLVIEDEPDMRTFVMSTLADAYRVASAPDGQAGLAMAQQTHPDLIISDMMMPQLNGDSLLSALRTDAQLNSVPVVLLTARADPQLRVQMLRAGAQDFLIKPFAVEELRARVQQLIATYRARSLLQQELASKSADIAEMAGRLAERSHELAKAVQARDIFLSIASHELKTPLTALLGFAELLERRAERLNLLPERDRNTVRIIAEQATKLNRLINGLLDLSRLDQDQFRLDCAPLDLGAMTRQVVEEIRQGLQNHTLTLHTPDQPVIINGDALRLEQVIYNLVHNAIKYSPWGGPIDVRIERTTHEACVMVSDRGIGVPVADQARLFQRFYRATNVNPRQISGTGIGLYVIKEIVARHGGSIQVQSAEGQGSTFSVYLPLKP